MGHLVDEETRAAASNWPNTTNRVLTFELCVVSGADKGAKLLVGPAAEGHLYIGKGQLCELRLDDALVSRRHASLEVLGDGLHVVDQGSTNGTFVNDVRVVEVVLRGGELIRVGNTELRVVNLGTEERVVSPPRDLGFGRFLGISPQVRRLHPVLWKLAASDVPLVVEGETGTGKEVLCEAIHEAGARASKPYVIFDCTAVPPTLAEAALFGHEKGSFTGATSARMGVFEQAQGGTLLIDELGDLDISLQPKLLRAIERGEIQRIGSNRWVRVDVRVVAATRRDLEAEIQKGRFRDDLYYRLAVARVELPALRRREGDIAFLARHFWEAMGGDHESLSNDFIEKMESYSWPGNVRELRNAVARHVALGELGEALLGGSGLNTSSEPPRGERDLVAELIRTEPSFYRARTRVMADFESRYLQAALAKHDGNVSRASDALGIGRRYFYIRRKKSS